MKFGVRLVRWCAEALGADFIQWRVLTAVMLKTDFRSDSALRMGSAPAREGASRHWVPLLMYAMLGLWVMALVLVLPDLFISGVWSLSAVSVVVAIIILIEFRSVVISPTDYEILAHQPISSRTYFLVKLTNLLLYTETIGVLVAGPTWILLMIRHGPMTGVVFPVITAAAVAWTALAMVSIYAGLLRTIRPARLGRILSFVQVLLTTLVMAAPLLLSPLEDHIETMTITSSPAMFALPAAWFASALPLASGEWSVTGVLAVLTAAGSTVCLFYIVGGRLSLSYAERLGALLAVSDPDSGALPARKSTGRRFPKELRAVATLMKGNFRYDMNFRMTVLGIVPVTLFYVYLSLREGALPDPFVDLGFGAGSLWTIHFVAIGGPQILLDSLFRSDSARAGWIFFTLPVDRAKLVTHAGHCIALFALVPYLVLLGGIFVWSFETVPHAIAHVVVLGLVSNLGIQLRLLMVPRLPFSEPPSRGGFSANALVAMVVTAILIGLLPLPLHAAYASTVATIVAIGLLAVANAVVPAIVARRIGPRLRRLEFNG